MNRSTKAAAVPISFPPLAPGTLVKARDRDNYGRVIEDMGDKAAVSTSYLLKDPRPSPLFPSRSLSR